MNLNGCVSSTSLLSRSQHGLQPTVKRSAEDDEVWVCDDQRPPLGGAVHDHVEAHVCNDSSHASLNALCILRAEQGRVDWK